MTDEELQKLSSLIAEKLVDPEFMNIEQFKRRAGITDWEWQTLVKDHPSFKKARSANGRKIHVKNGLYSVRKILMYGS